MNRKIKTETVCSDQNCQQPVYIIGNDYVVKHTPQCQFAAPTIAYKPTVEAPRDEHRERVIVLPGERPKYSWNYYYDAGMHWKDRKREADRCHNLVHQYLNPELWVYDCRVDIKVIVYFDKSPFDSCNIPAKIYIDGLHGLYIQDDDLRYVREVTTRSEIDKTNPRVEIILTPLKE